MATEIGYQFGVSEFTTWPWPFERDVETYAHLGVQAIEVCEFKLDPVRYQEQMAMPAAHGLEITSFQPDVRTLFPNKPKPIPADPRERMARFQDCIAKLAPFAPDAPFVTSTGMAPDGNVQRVLDTAAEVYRDVADFAAGHGARVALEPLSATIMNVETALWTVRQALDVIRAVDRPNFGLCLDCWNVWQNADLDAAIREAGDLITVVQISDWRTPQSFADRLIPGQGEIPLPAFLKSVREAGFTGAYSVEIFSGDIPDSLWAGDLEQTLRASRVGLDAAWGASI